MASRRLPAAPDVDHLKNQAKRLLAAFRALDTDAVADFSAYHPDAPAPEAAKLTDAQLVLARSYGLPSFPQLLTAARSQRRVRPFDASRRVTPQSVHALLRAHAPDLPVDDLELDTEGPQGGGFVLRYGTERLVKVPRIGSREELLTEARILDYLRGSDTGLRVPEPLVVHEKGFYAVYRVEPGRPMSPGWLTAMSPADQERAAESVARFFHALHTHEFPAPVVEDVPRADDGYDVSPARARRKIAFIREHGGDYPIDEWEATIDRLEPSLNQRFALTQCDPSVDYFVAIGGDVSTLWMGSLHDAHVHDPAVDLHDFILELRGDIDDAAVVQRMTDALLRTYPSDDPDLPAKIEFGLLGYDIRWAHIRVRAEVRARERAAQGGQRARPAQRSGLGRVPIGERLALLDRQDVDGSGGAVAGADDGLTAAGPHLTADGVDAINARLAVHIRLHTGALVPGDAERLGQLRRLALGEDQIPALRAAARLEAHREGVTLLLHGGHLVVDDRGAQLLDLRAGDLLEVRARHLLDAEVVLQQRGVHRRLVLTVDDDLLARLGQEQGGAQSAGAIAHDDNINRSHSISPRVSCCVRCPVFRRSRWSDGTRGQGMSAPRGGPAQGPVDPSFTCPHDRARTAVTRSSSATMRRPKRLLRMSARE